MSNQVCNDLSKFTSHQKDIVIKNLLAEVNKLRNVVQERDTLLCEVNRLKFELQISDIKRMGGGEDKTDSR